MNYAKLSYVGPGCSFCSANSHRGIFECLARCVWADFCQHNSITTLKHEVMTLYRCVAKIKMKVMFEDERFGVLAAPNLAGTDTEAVLGILPCFVMSHYVSLIASLTSGNLH